jgi:hypothetical protein
VADLATLQARLDQAQAAYHSLMTGALAVEVQHSDMRQRYSEANKGELAAYIASLKAQIAAAGGSTTGYTRRGLVVDL